MNIVKMWNESGKVGKILFVFFILTIIGAIVEPPAPPPDTPEQIAQKAKDKAKKDAEIMAVVGVFGKTTDALRDPQSIQIIQLYSKLDDKANVGCMVFRSKNGFGGYVEGYSSWAMVIDIPTERVKFSFAIDKPKQWNKYCRGEGYTDNMYMADALTKTLRGE